MTAYRQRRSLAHRRCGSRQRLQDLALFRPTPQDHALECHGWFERTERGVCALANAGGEALERWPQADRSSAALTYGSCGW